MLFPPTPASHTTLAFSCPVTYLQLINYLSYAVHVSRRVSQNGSEGSMCSAKNRGALRQAPKMAGQDDTSHQEVQLRQRDNRIADLEVRAAGLNVLVRCDWINQIFYCSTIALFALSRLKWLG